MFVAVIRNLSSQFTQSGGVPDLPFSELCASLDDGTVTATQLVDTCLAAIDGPAGEGARSFVSVARDRSRQEAQRIDEARRLERSGSPLAGLPIAVKDLFDVEGEVTKAGSVVLSDRAPAANDAPVVSRLREAGMIVLGRTNMTEFAYSGLGLNPHYDTPRSAWRRDRQHIPGGSSSGSAVAVADGHVVAALGTDTGGSCRIPAAFSNIVGYKPTAEVVPLDGVIPLAPSLDSVGPLAASVAACRAIHQLLAGQSAQQVGSAMTTWTAAAEQPIDGLRLAVLTDVVLDSLDCEVAERFENALTHLANAGVSLVERPLPALRDLATVNASGGIAAAEAFAWHQKLIASDGDRYDPLVRTRIEAGAAIDNASLADIVAFRRGLIETFVASSSDIDAWILPTVAILPPTIEEFVARDDFYRSANLMTLRNTSVGNMLDSCAISLPLCRHADRFDADPVGLMLMAPGMGDERLLALAQQLEPICRSVA